MRYSWYFLVGMGILSGFLSESVGQEFRKWTSGEKTAVGKVDSLLEDGKVVRIELKSGKFTRIPREALSEKDQKYLKQWEKKKSAPQKEKKKPTKKKSQEEPKEPVDTRTYEEREAERMQHFRETGVWRWPEVPEEEVAGILEKQKNFLQSIQDSFAARNMKIYESEHFFFVSDCPPMIANECTKYLELAYQELCKIFSLSEKKMVWHGKCPVIAFVNEMDYRQYEQDSTSAGLCHMGGDGDVYVTTFFGDVSRMEKRWNFIQVMVHEMTHGFVWRYKARGNPPTWLNEGIAEFVSAYVVKPARSVAVKVQHGNVRMQQTQSVGGLMQLKRLEAWQYGSACSLVAFMIQQKPAGIGEMLELIKEGAEWENALQKVYQCSANQLLFAFGRTLGIPNLQP